MGNLDLTPEDPRTAEEVARARAGTVHPEATPAAEIDPGPGAPPVVDPLAEHEVARWIESVGDLLALSLRTPPEQPDLWRFSEEEVAEISGPLARVVNSRALWLIRLIRAADLLVVVVILAAHFRRGLGVLRRLDAEEIPPEPEPAGGSVGPEGFGLGADPGV